jgi:hypothetical protein
MKRLDREIDHTRYEPSSGRLSSHVVAMWQGRTSSRGGEGSLTLTLTLALTLTLGVA